MTTASSRGGGVATYAQAFVLGAALGLVQTRDVGHAVILSAARTGLIPYPADNIQMQSYQGVFSLINLVLDLLLRAGMDVATASKLLEALQGGLYCAAAALIVHAISRRTVPAIAAGVLFSLTIPLGHGLHYTDYLISSSGSANWGIIGLGLVLTSLAALAAGWWRAAALLPALTILVHPVYGAWAALTGAAALVLGRHRMEPGRFRTLLLLGTGATIAAILVVGLSLPLDQRMRTTDVDRYLQQVYIVAWDNHRNAKIDLPRAMMLAQVAGLAGLMAWWHRRQQPAAAMFAVGVALSALAGIVLYVGFHIDRHAVPVWLSAEMPSRFINIPVALTFPVLAGLILKERPSLPAIAALALLVLAPMAARQTGLAIAEPAAGIILVLLTLVFLALAGRGRVGPPLRLPAVLEGRLDHGRRRLIGAAVSVAVAAGVTIGWWPVLLSETQTVRTTLQNLKQLPGPILMGDQFVVLVFARLWPDLPIHLDLTAFDFIPRLPYLSTKLADIVTNLYGVPFTRPPPSTQFKAGLALDSARLDDGAMTQTRQLWESWPLATWQFAAREYGFRSVAVPSQWRIDLPLALNLGLTPTGGGVNVYTIP